MLLLPVAFAPTMTVNGPKRMDSSAKFLKFLSLSDEIMRLARVLDCWKRTVTHLYGVPSTHRLGTDAWFQEVRRLLD